MKIQKMQGIGNDFVVYTDFDEQTTPNDVRKMCDRRFGIGADGVITVTESRISEAQYRMKFFNADGSIAEMCGNGIRCFAKYLLDNKLIKRKGKIFVDTDAGLIIPEILEHNLQEALVKVNMGQPVLYNPKQIALLPGNDGLVCFSFKNLQGTYVSMGNPHIVFFVGKGKAKQFTEEYGPELENMTNIFPEKTNVEFAEINNKKDLTMYVWERGVGLTLACGTAASATFVAAVKQGFSDARGIVRLPGGILELSWAGDGLPVFLTGSSKNVFEIREFDFVTTKKRLR